MPNEQEVAPDDTAVRVALWRALHVEVDARPHVFRASPAADTCSTFLKPTSRARVSMSAGVKKLMRRYFAGRTDGLRPPNNSEELLVATT